MPSTLSVTSTLSSSQRLGGRHRRTSDGVPDRSWPRRPSWRTSKVTAARSPRFRRGFCRPSARSLSIVSGVTISPRRTTISPAKILPVLHRNQLALVLRALSASGARPDDDWGARWRGPVPPRPAHSRGADGRRRSARGTAARASSQIFRVVVAQFPAHGIMDAPAGHTLAPDPDGTLAIVPQQRHQQGRRHTAMPTC